MQKKLLVARQELEETKKQIVIVQRNHDALAEKAKQDGPQQAKLLKKLDEYERELKMLKSGQGRSTQEMDRFCRERDKFRAQAQQLEEHLQTLQKEFQIERTDLANQVKS